MYAGQTGFHTFIQKLKKYTVLTSKSRMDIKKMILVRKILIVNPDFKRNFQRTHNASKCQLIITFLLKQVHCIRM